jgi:hypothetical protein
MSAYESLHKQSPCWSCLLKTVQAGASRRCVDFKRFGKPNKHTDKAVLTRCSDYVGPHEDKFFPLGGRPYYRTLTEHRNQRRQEAPELGETVENDAL